MASLANGCPRPKKIIVKMPNWLGDVVMATPILHDLKKKYPHSHVTAMCESRVAGLLKEDPYVDEIFRYKKPSGWIHRRQHGEIIEWLSLGGYDLGILLTNSFSSAWWFWRAGIKNRIGFEGNLRSFLLTTAVKRPDLIESQHQVITYKEILKPLDIAVSNTEPSLYVSQEENQHAKELLLGLGINPDKNIVVGINPGAAYGSSKCWLPERFRRLNELLLKHPNVSIVYFGDANGAKLVCDICQGFSKQVVDLAGRTNLRELIALIGLCSVFLTGDSGPMHIAAALKVPLLALFGSTSDVKTGPSYGRGVAKVIHKHVECSPCYQRECPIDFRCMKRIEVEEVLQTLRSMIDESSGAH